MADKKPSKAKKPVDIQGEVTATTNSDAEPQQQPAQPADGQKLATFGLQRVFIVKSNFALTDAPKVFKRAWNPIIEVGLETKGEHLEGDLYVTKTTIDISGKLEDQTAFEINLDMGGIFEIKGIEGDLLERTIYIVCPSIVFPYMREQIDSLMTKASFPPLMLAPIDFEALYRKTKEQREQESTALSREGSYRPKMPV